MSGDEDALAVAQSIAAGKILKDLSIQFNEFIEQLGEDAKHADSEIRISANSYTLIVGAIEQTFVGQSISGFSSDEYLRFRGVKITIRTDDAPTN